MRLSGACWASSPTCRARRAGHPGAAGGGPRRRPCGHAGAVPGPRGGARAPRAGSGLITLTGAAPGRGLRFALCIGTPSRGRSSPAGSRSSRFRRSWSSPSRSASSSAPSSTSDRSRHRGPGRRRRAVPFDARFAVDRIGIFVGGDGLGRRRRSSGDAGRRRCDVWVGSCPWPIVAGLLLAAAGCSNGWRTDMWYQPALRPVDAPPEPPRLGPPRSLALADRDQADRLRHPAPADTPRSATGCTSSSSAAPAATERTVTAGGRSRSSSRQHRTSPTKQSGPAPTATSSGRSPSGAGHAAAAGRADRTRPMGPRELRPPRPRGCLRRRAVRPPVAVLTALSRGRAGAHGDAVERHGGGGRPCSPGRGIGLGFGAVTLGVLAVSWLFFAGAAAGAVAFSAAVRCSRARWVDVISPVAEAGAAFFPSALALLAVLLVLAPSWMPDAAGVRLGSLGVASRA